MKNLILSIALVLNSTAYASSDAVVELSSAQLTFTDQFTQNKATILINYRALLGKDREIDSITVTWRGATTVIPSDELIGLSKLQIDTMVLRHGVYADGTKYHYIDTFFGDREEDAERKFKQVWLLMQGDNLVERKTFITLRTGPKSSHFKQLRQKFKGKPETKTNK